MLNISIAEECTDAPKKRYVRDFNMDCVMGRIADATDKLSDDIHWNVIGVQSITSKGEIAASLRSMNRNDIVAFSIKNAVLQGTRVVANGTIHLKNGSEVHFCDIYVFENHTLAAKIKEITTYSITLNSPVPRTGKTATLTIADTAR